MRSFIHRFTSVLVLTILSIHSFAQKIDEREIISLRTECGGVYFKSKEVLEKSWGKSLRFFDLKEGDKVADIGARSMTFIGTLAVFYENVDFYCEDIDSACTTPKQAQKVIDFYSKIKGSSITCKFIPVIGTETSTTLPKNFFDKVIIDNSLHEFSKKDLMMYDIHQILKVNGKLYLREAIGRTNGELHMGCDQALFDEMNLISYIAKQGFKFIKSEDSQIPTGAFISKLFVFEKE